jgi:subfamily B ATP-binding cassette protein MsbA
MGSLTSSIEQVLKGHKEVLMFGAQQKESDRFHQKNNHNRQQNMKLIVAKVGSVVTVQVIASFALAVVLYIASTPGAIENLTAGTFMSFLTSTITLLKPLKQLTTVNSELQKGMAACASIFEMLDERIERDTGKQDMKDCRGQLRFKDVTFSYANKEQPAIRNISFEIPAGSSLALVGRTGSGKSTISNLLTRFYDLAPSTDTGQGIFIDGHEVKDIKLKDLRKQFALVSQNVTLFNDTIANNIAYGATSALDTESERLIQDALDELQKHRTSLVVAHRLSTIENADMILVIEQGEIVERGDHKTLVEQDGMYAQLHKIQFGEVA